MQVIHFAAVHNCSDIILAFDGHGVTIVSSKGGDHSGALSEASQRLQFAHVLVEHTTNKT